MVPDEQVLHTSRGRKQADKDCNETPPVQFVPTMVLLSICFYCLDKERKKEISSSFTFSGKSFQVTVLIWNNHFGDKIDGVKNKHFQFEKKRSY